MPINYNKALATRLAQALQTVYEETGHCAACDCFDHAPDCPVRLVLDLPDEPDEDEEAEDEPEEYDDEDEDEDEDDEYDD